jgi:ubiquitin-conjugating enzyme E2 J2
MASRQSQKRLTKEYKNIVAAPPPYITTKPNDENILEWHYVITGPPGTPYEDGQYHGMLRFPSEYPFKPPSISMVTPNGRFACNTKLCLSMSDFHPDTWNPAWSVATILTGLLSFMTGDEVTTGSIKTSDAVKRRLARDSKSWNVAENQRFRKQFPDLTAQNRRDIEEQKTQAARTEELRLQRELQLQLQPNGAPRPSVRDNLDSLDPEDRARLFVEQDDKQASSWLQKYTILGVVLAGIVAATFNVMGRS